MNNDSVSSPTKMILLQEALALVGIMGWSKQTLERASATLGMPPKYYLLLFPEGPSEIVEFFELLQDQELLNKLTAQEKLPTSFTNRIIFAVKLRVLAEDRAIVQQTNNFYCSITKLNLGVKNAWRTADLIWCYFQDQSLDYNYYSKRGLLALAYTLSRCYYVQDQSLGYTKTAAFIEQTIRNISNIKYLKEQCRKLTNLPILRFFFTNLH